MSRRTSTAETSETGTRSRTTTTRSPCSAGAENRDRWRRTVRVTTVRWVIPAVVRDSSASRTTPWSSQLPKASTTGAPGAVKSSAPRPLNPLARTRSTGPASSAWPDPLSNRTTWVTSGDSSGEQAYSLLAGAVKTDSGTRWARPSPGTETGAEKPAPAPHRRRPPPAGRAPEPGRCPRSPPRATRRRPCGVRRGCGRPASAGPRRAVADRWPAPTGPSTTSAVRRTSPRRCAARPSRRSPASGRRRRARPGRRAATAHTG